MDIKNRRVRHRQTIANDSQRECINYIALQIFYCIYVNRSLLLNKLEKLNHLVSI